MPAGPELNDEPLPAGALIRLGTTRFRLGNMIYAMALSPDVKTAVTVGGNSQTQFWDVDTGKVIRRIEWKEGGGGRVVAYSPNGQLVAYVQDQGPLWLLNAADGKQLAKQDLGMNFTSSLAFSPDSTILATGGTQVTYGRHEDTKSNSLLSLWKWDGASLKLIGEAKPDHESPLQGPPRPHGIKSIAFSTDGTQLATGGNKGDLIRIWDPSNGRELHQFHASGDQIGSLVFAPTGSSLASGANNGGLTLWDLDHGTKKWESKLPGDIRTLAFAPDGKTLAAGGGAEYGHKKDDLPFLLLVDAESGKNIRPLTISRNSVASVAFSKDGQVLCAGLGGNLKVWQGSTGKERAAPFGHATWISDVAVAADGRTAVTAGGDGKLIVWDLATGGELRRLAGHNGEVRALGLVPGGKLVASAGTDQMVRIWELATGLEVRHFEASPDGLLYALAVSPDGKLVAAGDYHDGTVFIWDLVTGKVLHRFRIGDELGPAIMRLAFSPDSKRLAGGETKFNAQRFRPDREKTRSLIYLWDASTGEKLLQIPAHPDAVESLAFSPDGATIASTGMWDKTARIWNSVKGDELFELPVGEGHGVVRFSPDGSTLAIASESITLWEVASKKLRRKLNGSASHVQTLAFSPDGRQLVSGSMDSTGLVWDVTGVPKAELTAERLPGLWKDLASPDAEAAGKAIWSLANNAKISVPYLSEQLLKGRETLSAKPEGLQVLRGIETLEHAGTPEAANALTQFAKITSDEHFRQKALAAEGRLTKRAGH